MSIKIETQSILNTLSDDNNSRKILIMGKASSSFKAREILSPFSKEEAKSLYGESSLYDAYCLLIDMGISNVYTSNCYSESDYIRLIDKLIHYSFDYIVPIDMYLSDKFYNPLSDKEEYYLSYFLTQLATVESLSTILITERHAELYQDFDNYMKDMSDIEFDFINYHESNNNLLDKAGNNLNFIYNNIKDVPFANVILGGLYCKRDYAKYLKSIKDKQVIFNIDNIDMLGLRAMYPKYNTLSNDITIENTFNFSDRNDIYANALIDDVMKRVIKEIDLSEYKGRLFNPCLSIQIKSKIKNKLDKLKGLLFKRYKINKVSYTPLSDSTISIISDITIVPYGTLEEIRIMIGVI